MKTPVHILIADRNPHICHFLKRELSALGYVVRLADHGQDLLRWVGQPDALDMLILDPYLPGIDDAALWNHLHQRAPNLPTIIHAVNPEVLCGLQTPPNVMFVEKGGNSLEQLKTLIKQLFESPA